MKQGKIFFSCKKGIGTLIQWNGAKEYRSLSLPGGINKILLISLYTLDFNKLLLLPMNISLLTDVKTVCNEIKNFYK